ncbi:MAG: hypothetical protein RLZZ382_2262 [Bacteroidota bacterium]
MVIAINCRHLTPKKLEGFGAYTYELVTRWIKEHHEVNFVLIFDREPAVDIPELPNVKKILLVPRLDTRYCIGFGLNGRYQGY